MRLFCAVQLGDHRAALRTLALTLGDIRLAEAYCARFTGHDGHLLLLDLLLHPGDERPPLYLEACHLLAAQGSQQLCRPWLFHYFRDMEAGSLIGTAARCSWCHTASIQACGREAGLPHLACRLLVVSSQDMDQWGLSVRR